MLEHFGKNVSILAWIASFIVLLGFVIVVFPFANLVYARLMDATLNPDTQIFYQAKQLIQMGFINGYYGRMFFVFWHLSFDVVWPLIYLVFLFFTMSIVLRNLSVPMVSLLYALPLIVFGFDVGENLSLSFAMINFPVRSIWLYVAPWFTLFKWLSLALVLACFIALFVLQCSRFAKR
ncbi:MAG: hypothetical protein ACRCZJ_06730 [Erysipelotrichaceae bacterium]